MSNLLKNLIFALGLAVILWLGYSLFVKNNDEALVTSSNDRVNSRSAAETQEFLVRLQQLHEVSLDRSLFSDERFVSLFSFRQDLGEQESGRKNPFAPVEDDEDFE